MEWWEKQDEVVQFHPDAETAIREGMRSIRQYEARAVFIAVAKTQGPRDVVPDGKFYARDESGEWEAI